MAELCKLDCCKDCPQRAECPGCSETGGHPFGGDCVAAECIKKKGFEAFPALKKAILEELNALGIPGLEVEDLSLLPGRYINLEYVLPNGQRVKLLEDGNVYFGAQVEVPGSHRCYGVAADERYLLVCEYGDGGSDGEIVCYRRRG